MFVSCTCCAPASAMARTPAAMSSGVPWMTVPSSTSSGTAAARASASSRPMAMGCMSVRPNAPLPSGWSTPTASNASDGRVSAMNRNSSEFRMTARASSRESATTTRQYAPAVTSSGARPAAACAARTCASMAE